jgi:Tol biopolymer transport system component
MYDCGTKNITQITKTGYNFGPAYCAHTGQIAYTSMKNKYMQIFLFDPQTGIHQQLTTDQSHKEDCSWSPGGDHLLVCVTRDTGQRLALYNVITRSYTYLTDTKKRCSDPHWSPPYKEFPVLFE